MADRDPTDPLGSWMGGQAGEAPLLRELQRVLLASTGPVNWELARQIGIAMASWGSEDPPPSDDDRRGLEQTVRAAELAVAEFTSLAMPSDVARVQPVRRADWVEANIAGLRDVLEPVAAKLGGAFGEAQLGVPPAFGEAPEGAELVKAMMDRMAPLLVGFQVGTVLGYLGQRVLGQYDLAVPRPAPTLLFVVPNIAHFEREWSLSSMEFRAWVALHEVTHRFEFARPWVREHFLELVRDLVEHAEIDLAGMQQRLEQLDLGNPQAMSQAFDSLGNPFGQAAAPEQRLRIARVQAFIAAAEGYGDHVTESVAETMLPSYAQIREAVGRHRDDRHGDQAMERLLGLEMKREQYRLGREFCTSVAAATDEATLSRMWESREALPSMPEIEEPRLWLARVA